MVEPQPREAGQGGRRGHAELQQKDATVQFYERLRNQYDHRAAHAGEYLRKAARLDATSSCCAGRSTFREGISLDYIVELGLTTRRSTKRWRPKWD